MPQIDIHSTVLTAVIIMGVAVVLTLIFGVRNIIKSRKVPFFRKRHDRMMRGWRMVVIAVLLIILAWATLNYSEPIIYSYISPSPTRTQTPTITLTPSITLSPTITLTPTITDTPSITNTPSLPGEIEELFEAEITPNPDAIFSLLEFSQKLGDDLLPRDPGIEFENPIGHLFGSFSYNNMSVGVQWSALWIREGEVVHFETKPWDGGSGGYGYTDWNPPSSEWKPGLYEVQIFVGSEWMVSGFFTVIGEPPVPSITPTPTQTFTPSRTPTKTPTMTPTQTLWPTSTVTLVPTPTNTRTPRPTSSD